MSRLKIAVIGHVEHITLGRVPEVPRAGEIAHLQDVVEFPGGGGGVAFYQLVKSDAEVHVFTALGNDQAAQLVERELTASGGIAHVARRDVPHTRDVVMIDRFGERTIVVVGEPLHPLASDPLPWDLLGECDAVYFTATDPQILLHARAARRLVATARRREAILQSGVKFDVILGSARDAREASVLADYPLPPDYLVMTEGEDGGRVDGPGTTSRFTAPQGISARGGSYGAGDSFAGALTYYLAAGFLPLEAAARAAEHGAAVLSALNPLHAQRWLGVPPPPRPR